MNWSMTGFPVLHYFLELAETHVHWVSDAIQPSHPLSPPSPPALSRTDWFDLLAVLPVGIVLGLGCHPQDNSMILSLGALLGGDSIWFSPRPNQGIFILCFDIFSLLSWSGMSHEKQNLEFCSDYISTAKSRPAHRSQQFVVCANIWIVNIGKNGAAQQRGAWRSRRPAHLSGTPEHFVYQQEGPRIEIQTAFS